MEIRALQPEDAAAARALIVRQLGGTRYEARALELLSDCVASGDDELVGTAMGHGVNFALALHGVVAGAMGVIKLHMAVGADDSGVARLVQRVIASRGEDARLYVCEVSADSMFDNFRHACLSAGFREEAYLTDYIADGIALRILTRRATD